MNVAIIGLGLIGGSIGLALREAGFGAVAGYDRQPEVVARALERGAIDWGAASAAAAAREAELVILATPPLALRQALLELAPALNNDAIVTDAASTKQHVLQWAKELLPGHTAFVGGHPMAGSEQHGIASARSALFGGAVWCLTPDHATPAHALAAVETMIRVLGATPLRMDAAAHDAAVAAVSHLPFVLAAALVETALGEQQADRRRLAAGGFRDTTRTASGDALMHRDICLANAQALRPLLGQMARRLDQLAERLDDGKFLLEFFADARQTRDDWANEAGETRTKGEGETRTKGEGETRTGDTP